MVFGDEGQNMVIQTKLNDPSLFSAYFLSQWEIAVPFRLFG